MTAHWDHPAPFVVEHRVQPEEIDELGHVNNVHYLDWLQRCAWEHSAAVGYDVQQMRTVDRAMVVKEVRMHYLRATHAGDVLLIGDWLVANDGRLRATRRFQILRENDDVTVMRAEIDYVCIEVSSGRPKRMPPEFTRAYEVAATTARD
ncbi:MAG: thioesterase family protein [Pseudomonadota bacterium]